MTKQASESYKTTQTIQLIGRQSCMASGLEGGGRLDYLGSDDRSRGMCEVALHP